jgi:signal transduction histidine kinase
LTIAAGSTLTGRLGLRSLAFRVIALSTLWAMLALLVISTIVSSLYRENAERGFKSLLQAHLFNLISSVDVTPDGRLTGSPNLGDIRFADVGSGWYWAVDSISDGLKGSISSVSMGASALPIPSLVEAPRNEDFQRHYAINGLAGEKLDVVETDVELDARDQVARFRVMGNRTELDDEINDFNRRLFTYLGLFGAGMIAINAAAILIGMRPLGRVREALAQVRKGTAKRLDGRFPSEIEPLANETNALIDNNRRIVERSRTQVGNLAHSLKTPLAVMLNEGRSIGGVKGALIAEQAVGMQQQVEHYLQRARVAAQRDSVVYRTPVAPTIERMARVMQKLNPKIEVTSDVGPAGLTFAGEREDLEEIVGNLMENALKWGRKRVRLSTGPAADTARLSLLVEDDGPGIPPEKAREALQRGRRLDESKPGTGLGLAIVADLSREYGGQILLERSELGGLKAVVELPVAE